ncbi:MAG TPA: hypothetical protein VE863_10335 [Pyrinomonadaceae bacterium]|nr:hypothetical protein [Pyrinomonadaceae bacterium]
MPLFLNPFNFDFTTIDWKVVIGILAVSVAAFGLFYFQWWRNRKRLSYEITSDVVLISTEKEIRDKVEVRYEGQPVKNVHLLVVRLINDGYQPIKRDDFEKPIKFLFPKARILTAEKVKYHPKNLATQIHYRDDWLEMDPALFNRRDYIQFKVLLTEYDVMHIDARIVGVSSIERSQKACIPEFFILVPYYCRCIPYLPFCAKATIV